jgi:MoaA/NifB/PqqE/SkfB family radical SAM enzyme
MQKEILKIDEIIWEVCGACRNGCSYCGSKEGWNTPINEETIKKIVDKIVEYKRVKEINISGGDPLLVSLSTHAYITNNFRTIGIKPKILINPRSFQIEPDRHTKFKILDMYSWIGISINEEIEIEYFEDYLVDWVNRNIKVTIISNFNVTNVFMFAKIRELVNRFKLTWQIQYTVYNDPKDKMALYNSEEANKYFYENIQSAMDVGTKIVVADNMNEGTCGAGSNSIGILSNGDVVPCLSMRSWVPELYKLVQGNIIGRPLSSIWQTEFTTYRFDEYKCCKDHCNNKCFKRSITVAKLNELMKTGGYEPRDYPQKFPIPPELTRTLMYGVDTGRTYVYGVATTNLPLVQAYYSGKSFTNPPIENCLDIPDNNDKGVIS